MSKVALFNLGLGLSIALSLSLPMLATADNNSNQPANSPASTQPNKINEAEVFEAVTTSGKIEKLKRYLDNGGSANRFLHTAINAGSIDSVKMMLDRGANANLVGDEGLTPLMIAAKANYRSGIKMSELLISKGAKVNAKANRGSTPLMFASWGVAPHYEDEYVRLVQLLIKSGAKVNVKNKMGDSPLSIAKGGNWNKIIATLKKAGAKA